jgi:GMP synthase (glutamine-hydrolysing)
MDTILILDFGGQTTQLIGRRIRDLGIYSEIVPGDTPLDGLIRADTRGLILSGSPFSVYDPDSPRPDPALSTVEIPILGICYGIQRLIQDEGGNVAALPKREFGRSAVRIQRTSPLLKGLPDGFLSWMSHGDTIQSVAPGYHVAATTENDLPAILIHEDKPVYGLQFHPEVTHSQYGERLLENFAVEVCGARKQWNVEAYLSSIRQGVRDTVGDERVLLLTSGGVDSTVVAALLLETLRPEQVYLMYIDSGLMRKNETEEVRALLGRLGAAHLHIIDASDRFFGVLAGVSDPEEKRRVIGDMFITVQEQEIRRLGIKNSFLAQGTLYTDMIESGKGVGKKADVIKSHHNVRSPLVEEKRAKGLLLEPLSTLYKDEVRRLGEKLGLPRDTVWRHPFPGPGLAVRILGEITREKVRILQNADHIYLEELKGRELYDQIWQAFAVMLPLRSVGVAGDIRRYGYVLALRAVVSRDGMTADVYPFPTLDLLEISSRITNEVAEIGRVVYDVSSKPPATIEWE